MNIPNETPIALFLGFLAGVIVVQIVFALWKHLPRNKKQWHCAIHGHKKAEEVCRRALNTTLLEDYDKKEIVQCSCGKWLEGSVQVHILVHRRKPK